MVDGVGHAGGRIGIGRRKTLGSNGNSLLVISAGLGRFDLLGGRTELSLARGRKEDGAIIRTGGDVKISTGDIGQLDARNTANNDNPRPTGSDTEFERYTYYNGRRWLPASISRSQSSAPGRPTVAAASPIIPTSVCPAL